MNRIIFEIEDGPIEAISKILRKNNLEKHLNDFYGELDDEEEPKEVAIVLKTKELILGKISEEGFLLFLKEKLQATEEQVKEIRKDIEKDLIKFAKKITTIKKVKEPEKPTLTFSLKPSVAIGLEENKKGSDTDSENPSPKN